MYPLLSLGHTVPPPYDQHLPRAWHKTKAQELPPLSPGSWGASLGLFSLNSRHCGVVVPRFGPQTACISFWVDLSRAEQPWASYSISLCLISEMGMSIVPALCKYQNQLN